MKADDLNIQKFYMEETSPLSHKKSSACKAELFTSVCGRNLYVCRYKRARYARNHAADCRQPHARLV